MSVRATGAFDSPGKMVGVPSAGYIDPKNGEKKKAPVLRTMHAIRHGAIEVFVSQNPEVHTLNPKVIESVNASPTANRPEPPGSKL
jgi:hypothetical protein